MKKTFILLKNNIFQTLKQGSKKMRGKYTCQKQFLTLTKEFFRFFALFE